MLRARHRHAHLKGMGTHRMTILPYPLPIHANPCVRPPCPEPEPILKPEVMHHTPKPTPKPKPKPTPRPMVVAEGSGMCGMGMHSDMVVDDDEEDDEYALSNSDKLKLALLESKVLTSTRKTKTKKPKKGKGLTLSGFGMTGCGLVVPHKEVKKTLEKAMSQMAKDLQLPKFKKQTSKLITSVLKSKDKPSSMMKNISEGVVLHIGRMHGMDMMNHPHFEKLKKKLNTALTKTLKAKHSLNPKHYRGDGLGGSFFKDFYKGFKMVFKPGAKILGTVATAVGAPEIGIPLTAVSGLM